MRNILLFVFLIVAIGIQAQTATFNLGSASYYKASTDYTVTNTTESWFQFNAPKNHPVTLDFEVLLTKGTGSHTDMSVALYGRKFDGDSWTQIGTTQTTGTITTTATVTFNVTTHLRYRQFKLSYTGTGIGTTTISDQYFKVWYQ